jgi:hypothetical protein
MPSDSVAQAIACPSESANCRQISLSEGRLACQVRSRYAPNHKRDVDCTAAAQGAVRIDAEVRYDPFEYSAVGRETEISLSGVICPNRICDGFVVLTAEEVRFLRMKDWESHLNLICPTCRTRFQARASDVLEREVRP